MSKKVVIIIAIVIFAGSFIGFYFLNKNQQKVERAAFQDYLVTKDVYVKFGLKYEAVTAKHNGIKRIVNVSEGEYTPLRIHNYNQWAQINGWPPLTLEEILNNPTDIEPVWDDNGPMTLDDIEKIFLKTDYLIIVEDIDIYGNPIDKYGNPILFDENGNQIDGNGNIVSEPTEPLKLLVSEERAPKNR